MKTLLEYYQILLEDQDYEGIFNYITQKFPDQSVQTKPIVDSAIKWAKKVLKKNDRIVWYLRIVRFALDCEFGTPIDEAVKNYNRLSKSNLGKYDLISYDSQWRIRNLNIRFEHFFSMNNPKIERVVFDRQAPNTILDLFAKIEEDSKEKVNDDAGAEEMYQKKRLIKQQPDDDIVLQFPDKFAWVDLHTPADDEEGEAMGHCGNRASYRRDETILSLRRSINYNGKKWWYPVCTFILDGNGRLGEMKGRNNEKPVDKYHPYIIALLKKTDIIHGIKGGGYKPENNFSLNDLTDDEKEEVEEANPSLEGAKRLYDKEGMTKRVLDRLYEELSALGIPGCRAIEYVPESKDFVVYEWADFERFVSNIYDNQVEKVLKVALGEADWQPTSGDPVQAFADLIKQLDQTLQQKIMRKAGYETAIESDFADAAKKLEASDDFYWQAFEKLIKNEQLWREKAWERLGEYVDIGWEFNCGGGVNIPSDPKELKEFVTSGKPVKLLLDEKTLLEIGSSSEDDEDMSMSYGVDMRDLIQHGFDHISEHTSYIHDRRIEDGLVTNYTDDTFLTDLEKTSFEDDYVDVLNNMSGHIEDPRQGTLLEKSIQRLRTLSGIF